ncbi:MAG: hypothetical protein SchgKO_08630 [Schleiferiaceae bacterium]
MGKTSTSGGHYFSLVGEVVAPTHNGTVFYATSVEIFNDLAYVTYHRKGDPYGGFVEVIDISDPVNPYLISQLYVSDTDFHTVNLSNNQVMYMSGARDVYSSGHSHSGHAGAIAMKLQLNQGALTPFLSEVPLPSFATNSVTEYGHNLFAVAGDLYGSGVYTLDKNTLQLNNQPQTQDLFDDPEYLEVHGSNLVVIEGGQYGIGQLRIYNDPTNLSQSTKVPLPYHSTKIGKNVLHIDNGKAYLAMGGDGLISVDLNSHAVTQYSQSHEVSGVTTDDDYLYAAITGGGLVVMDKNNPNQVIGTYTYPGSANYVTTDGQLIFIANGEGGLKILKKDEILDPFCTNQLVVRHNPNLSTTGQVNASAMGTYVEVNGVPRYRWRIQNQTGNPQTVNWEIQGTTESGVITLPIDGEVFFSSIQHGTLDFYLGTSLVGSIPHSGGNIYLATCSSSPPVSSCATWAGLPVGMNMIQVNPGGLQQYNVGNANLQGVEVLANGSLDMCGTLAVSGPVDIEGNLSMEGTLTATSVSVKSGGTLSIDGSMVVFNNLTLENGSTLNFNGTLCTVVVLGTVTNNGATINGTYIGTPL